MDSTRQTVSVKINPCNMCVVTRTDFLPSSTRCCRKQRPTPAKTRPNASVCGHFLRYSTDAGCRAKKVARRLKEKEKENNPKCRKVEIFFLTSAPGAERPRVASSTA